MTRYIITTLLLSFWTLADIKGQHFMRLDLPNHEKLSSERVLQVIQDAEGFLWYATEGGGVCRDDGRNIVVFRSDAKKTNLLGSNDVACVAEAGQHIIIGTFHGACVLDKQDYSIRRLMEVDDKRVDDIIVASNNHWWMTANKKIYEYNNEGQLLKMYAAGDKYIARLHEDRKGLLWASQWDGGLMKFDNGKFISAPWPLDATPTSIDDDISTGGLLIGTIGKGVVRYQSDSGTVELTEPRDSICMSRVSRDLKGRLLVADGLGNCFVLCDTEQQSWFEGTILTKYAADSIRTVWNLSSRPTAFTFSNNGTLWFSTGKDIRNMKEEKETIVLSDTKDVSAMTFTKDGTLWLATIFGTLMTYKDGLILTDDYASNEYGDAVIHMDVDSLGRLLLVSDHYVRIYDPVRQTLRQQTRKVEGVYSIELQETKPCSRWSQPLGNNIMERMPQWIWWILITVVLTFSVLIAQVWYLYRQRKRFLAVMKKDVETHNTPTDSQDDSAQPKLVDEWLKKAIAQVEFHLSDESYSVEQLSNDLCMSRMTFYRRIQSATGQKPTEFMRTIRLRRAAELLHDNSMTITEVSDATGFSSVSYFSRCFRTMYGVSPTQFGKATTTENSLPQKNPN